MTYEEALKIIEKHATAVIRGTSKNTLGEALGIATEALEKQIPKKLTKNVLGNICCPTCKRAPLIRCWCCGQALDWSEENDKRTGRRQNP